MNYFLYFIFAILFVDFIIYCLIYKCGYFKNMQKRYIPLFVRIIVWYEYGRYAKDKCFSELDDKTKMIIQYNTKKTLSQMGLFKEEEDINNYIISNEFIWNKIR